MCKLTRNGHIQNVASKNVASKNIGTLNKFVSSSNVKPVTLSGFSVGIIPSNRRWACVPTNPLSPAATPPRHRLASHYPGVPTDPDFGTYPSQLPVDGLEILNHIYFGSTWGLFQGSVGIFWKELILGMLICFYVFACLSNA